MKHSTISLIGMPGAGKSTIGVLLAKELGLSFVDSDLIIQVRHDTTLQDLLDRHGHLQLRQYEEEVLLDIPLAHSLIATGGSAVYSVASMQRLRDAGPGVFVDVPLPTLLERVDNEANRGIARAPGQDFISVFEERIPLYRRHADITFAANELSAREVCRLLCTQLCTQPATQLQD
jgi:shikimate kinase